MRAQFLSSSNSFPCPASPTPYTPVPSLLHTHPPTHPPTHRQVRTWRCAMRYLCTDFLRDFVGALPLQLTLRIVDPAAYMAEVCPNEPYITHNREPYMKAYEFQ